MDKGNFILKLKTNGTEDKIKLDFSLKEANKKSTHQKYNSSKKAGIFSKFSQNEKRELILKKDNNSNGGSPCPLQFKQKVHLTTHLQFEGTGIIQIKEPKIGQINLFRKNK